MAAQWQLSPLLRSSTHTLMRAEWSDDGFPTEDFGSRERMSPELQLPALDCQELLEDRLDGSSPLR